MDKRVAMKGVSTQSKKNMVYVTSWQFWEPPISGVLKIDVGSYYQVAEKVNFHRLLKNAPAFAEAASRRQADAS